MKILLRYFLLLLMAFSKSMAQEDIAENLIEELSPSGNEEELETIINNITELYQDPIDLNKAERSDLEKIYFLTTKQIDGIIKHRQVSGPYESLYELQVIEDLNISTIRKLLPIVAIKSSSDSWKGMINRISKGPVDVIVKYERSLEKKKGYTSEASESTRYMGSPYKTYLRLRNSRTRDYSIGITAEKDAGEIFKWQPDNNYYLYDFTSFHISVFQKGKLEALTIGDYKIQSGQGLVFGSGYYLGKNSEAVTGIKRSGSFILPHTSVTENGFYRGMAASYRYKQFTITGFYSSTKKDATVNSDTSEASSGYDYISTIYTTGYHRTQSEINKKAAIRETDLGGIIHYQNIAKTFNIGLNFIKSIFNTSFEKDLSVYNSFDFRGRNNATYSLDASYRVYNLTFFSEAAISSQGGKAMIAGLLASLHKKADFIFLARDYDKSFHSFYGRAFGENSANKNERGFYWGIKITPNKKYVLSAYYDTYQFPWLKYQVYKPSKGNDFNIRFSYLHSKSTTAYVQLRMSVREQNDPSAATTYQTEETNNMIQSICLDHKANEKISLSTKIILTKSQQNNLTTKGYFLVQDINVHFRKVKVSLRYALSDAENYDNRANVFEKDVLAGYAMPAYYGKGSRAYILMQGKIYKNLSCWLKYGCYIYPYSDMTGSGSEETRGNTRSEIKIQLRYTLS